METMNRVLFSSISVEWATPKGVYDKLNSEFGFNFDPCPLGGTDGLTKPWNGKRVYCNPPYNAIADFLCHAQEAELAVYLLPARTDTQWFHVIVLPLAREIRFIRGRLKFGEATNSAPFPSMVVVFARTEPPINGN